MANENVQNVEYVNFRPDFNNSTQLKDLLRDRVQSMGIVYQWISLKVDKELRAEIEAGKLPSDQSIEAQHRKWLFNGKVMNRLLVDMPWFSLSTTTNVQRAFNLTRGELYGTIHNAMADCHFPSVSISKLNPVIDGVIQNAASGAEGDSRLSMLVTVYTYIEDKQRVDVAIANPQFGLTVRSVGGDSFRMDVNLTNQNFVLNYDTFTQQGRKVLVNELQAAADDIARKPVDVPID